MTNCMIFSPGFGSSEVSQMFRFFVVRSASIYTFMSGVFASVGTNTLSTVVFSADKPPNLPALYGGTVVTVLASIVWFAIGEYVGNLKAVVERNAEGFGGSREERLKQALVPMQKDKALGLYLLLLTAIALSVVWPFAGCL